MSMTLEQFVEQLHGALGDRLKCVILYGSTAAGDSLSREAKHDLLVVAEPLGIAELDALMPLMSTWTKAGEEVPQLMTPAQLAASADTFPIEMADMQQSRRLLFGNDLLAGLTFNRDHLRLQLEREWKGKLLLLRRKYVLTAGHAKSVTSLLTDSLSTFLVLSRATLRLFETDVPVHKLDALRRLTSHIPFDPQPILHVVELKQTGGLPSGTDPRDVFAGYLNSIEVLVEAVDRLLHAQSGVSR